MKRRVSPEAVHKRRCSARDAPSQHSGSGAPAEWVDPALAMQLVTQLDVYEETPEARASASLLNCLFARWPHLVPQVIAPAPRFLDVVTKNIVLSGRGTSFHELNAALLERCMAHPQLRRVAHLLGCVELLRTVYGDTTAAFELRAFHTTPSSGPGPTPSSEALNHLLK
jgi:hypothetical protein